MILLNTAFSEDEKRIIEKYIFMDGTEIKFFYAVDETLLFHEGADGTLIPAEEANRMIEAGGLILLEEKSDIGNWNMGSLSEKKGYVFWGEYGDLDTALRCL